MPDTGNAKDCNPQISIFLLFKKRFDELIRLVSQQVLFSISFCLYRACFTHLSSSNLSCNLCLWHYHQKVPFNKEIHANVYRHSLWEYSERFHFSFEWHLTPHMTLSIETFIRRTPCIKRTMTTAFPEGVRLIQVSLYNQSVCKLNSTLILQIAIKSFLISFTLKHLISSLS